jgi:DNA-binding LytR/AlgR family response regulator
MNHYRCLIVDDEPLARDVIENYIKNFSFIELIASCENAIIALDWIKKQEIDLVFLDISMPFISGIDFIKTLQKPPAIILTTAYKEFAVESYELPVLDYLMKPISFERFLKAINKLNASSFENIKSVINKPEPDAFIYVKADKKNVKVLLKEILFIESIKDYIKIHVSDKTIITQLQISAIEQRLPDNFLRIHRSFIISRNKITAYTEHDVEIGKYQIPIGRSYKAVVSKAFASI